ncbi:hypothetical protein [Pyrobaculum sp.]|uniref:hypothetical protein n=1 Tax=Pyrobaculum sp. TaxID=2004705 RepID=UPI00316550A7
MGVEVKVIFDQIAAEYILVPVPVHIQPLYLISLAEVKEGDATWDATSPLVEPEGETRPGYLTIYLNQLLEKALVGVVFSGVQVPQHFTDRYGVQVPLPSQVIMKLNWGELTAVLFSTGPLTSMFQAKKPLSTLNIVTTPRVCISQWCAPPFHVESVLLPTFTSQFTTSATSRALVMMLYGRPLPSPERKHYAGFGTVAFPLWMALPFMPARVISALSTRVVASLLVYIHSQTLEKIATLVPAAKKPVERITSALKSKKEFEDLYDAVQTLGEIFARELISVGYTLPPPFTHCTALGVRARDFFQKLQDIEALIIKQQLKAPLEALKNLVEGEELPLEERVLEIADELGEKRSPLFYRLTPEAVFLTLVYLGYKWLTVDVVKHAEQALKDRLRC